MTTPLLSSSSSQDPAPPPATAPSYGGAHATDGAASGETAFPHLLLAVINRLSGERSASEAVFQAFCATFGARRVAVLDSDTFKDPSTLRRRIRAAHTGFELEDHGAALSGTVLVAGGDGSVAFVMNLVEEEFLNSDGAATTADDAAVTGSRGDSDDAVRPARHAASIMGGSPTSKQSNSSGGLVLVDDSDDEAHRGMKSTQRATPPTPVTAARRAPVVAVFPMGTGNDLSYTLGFGLGFTENHLCCGCVCLPQNILRIVQRTLDSPVVPFDRWIAEVYEVEYAQHGAAAAETQTLVRRVRFNNYFSVGMDADVARRFDEGRRDYPKLHSLRTMNKLWYGIHGLTATPSAPTFTNQNLAISIDSSPAPLPKSALDCKAIVVTNVAGYSGGVDLWNMTKPATQALPRQVLMGRKIELREVSLVPSSVGDGQLEVQTLGGLIHMTVLRSGIIGADRVGQGADVELFISAVKGGAIRAQADGEPLGAFNAPFVVKIRRSAVLGMRAATDSIALARTNPTQVWH